MLSQFLLKKFQRNNNYYLTHKRKDQKMFNATQRNATQRNATQRNATQRNATQNSLTTGFQSSNPFLGEIENV